MLRSPRPGPHAPRPAGWKRAAVLGALALALWGGCTVTRENYATLSLFFDGVPNPDAPGRVGAAGDQSLAPAVVVHPPFAQEKCETCHKTQYRPSRNDASPCLSCHADIKDRQVWTHGAVAGGACLWCHSPHESARQFLLRSPDRKLCMQCHSAAQLNGSAVPAHADTKVGCLECHFGHGGDNSLMLRPGATAQAVPAAADSLGKPPFRPDYQPPAGPSAPAAAPLPQSPLEPGDDPTSPKDRPATDPAPPGGEK